MEDMLTFLANEGFAIAVAMYTLMRLEKTMKENTMVMTELITVFKKGEN